LRRVTGDNAEAFNRIPFSSGSMSVKVTGSYLEM
jgi:hypothetical protein